jgi:hypothetical protein
MHFSCPTCGIVNDMHSTPDGAGPGIGAVSLCWNCGSVGVFEAREVRKPTPAELAKIMAMPEVRKALGAMSFGLGPMEAMRQMRG